MNGDYLKWVKGAAAVLILVILLFVVTGWVGDYRSAAEAAKAKAASESATATAAAAKKSSAAAKASTKPAETSPADAAATAGRTLVVKIDGLNFRRDSTPEGKAIRGLKKGEKLTLVKAEGNWYLVKDSKGVQGYISSNSQYTSIEK